jgi:hypothetical protein
MSIEEFQGMFVARVLFWKEGVELDETFTPVTRELF